MRQVVGSPMECDRHCKGQVGKTWWSQVLMRNKRRVDFCWVMSSLLPASAECACSSCSFVWLCAARQDEPQTIDRNAAHSNSSSPKTYDSYAWACNKARRLCSLIVHEHLWMSLLGGGRPSWQLCQWRYRLDDHEGRHLECPPWLQCRCLQWYTLV